MSAPTTGQDYASCRFINENRHPSNRCTVHGGHYVGTILERTSYGETEFSMKCQTIEVLADVRAERTRQFATYGTNADLEDGTGPYERWLEGVGMNVFPATAVKMEAGLRKAYEAYEKEHGAPTWRHLVLEEVAEVFAENDATELRKELVQVAALAVSWIEKIDAREE